MIIGEIKPRPTRYAGLGYWQQDKNLWRIVDMHEPGRLATVGPQYRTKTELLADLDNYARDVWGY